ncbi:MAG: ABC transporter ATP-binding protein [Thermoprotei archaeon]|nr:MAG: ABC transporter ATP-binding protein [Thermoprotei archaeon]
MLAIRGVRKSFGGLKALDGVDMDVNKGSLTMLIGPNGSGKTTLINVISGFYRPDEGKVLFEGKDITGLPPHKIFHMGLVRTFQVPSPFIKLTVLENLLTAYPGNPGESFLKAPFRKAWAKKEEEAVERAFRIMELLELDHLWDQPSYALSGGQLKLLEIGRALMTGARMILLDEPASGVNPALAHKLFSHLVKVKDELGVTFFIIEHRLEIAAKYVDYVYAMVQGRVISQGSADHVLKDPAVIEGYLGG